MAGPRRASLPKIDGQLRAWIQSVRMARGVNRRELISKWRAYADEQNFQRVLEVATKTPDLNFILLGDAYPKDLSRLKWTSRYKRVPLDRELLFHASVFAVESEKINSFIQLETQLSELLFESRFEDALRLLDQVQGQFGLSIWEMENRLFILHQLKRDEEVRQFVAQVRAKHDLDLLVWLLPQFYAVKLDDDFSVASLQQILDDVIAAYAARGHPAAELSAMRSATLFSGTTLSNDDAAILLWSLTGAPVIDRYLNLLQILPALYANAGTEGSLRFIRRPLEILLSRVSDERLNRLAEVLDVHCPNAQTPVEYSQVLDLYTRGKYDECQRACDAFWRESPQFDELVELAGRAAARCGRLPSFHKDLTLGRRVRELFTALLRKHKHFEVGVEGLQKLNVQLMRHPWSMLLDLKVKRESRWIDSSQTARLNAMEAAVLQRVNPRRQLGVFDDATRLKMRQRMELVPHNGPTNRLVQALVSSSEESIRKLETDTEIAKARRTAYSAHWFLRAGEEVQAKQRFELLRNDFDPLNKNVGTSGLVSCALKRGDIQAALKLISESFLSGERIHVSIPLSAILNDIADKQVADLNGNLDLAICISIAGSGEVKDSDMWLSDVFEDYLELAELKVPSDLRKTPAKIADPKVNYFLSHICVPRVMHGTLPFVRSEDVLQERIAICQLLSEQEPKRAAGFADEIKSLTQTLIIRAAVKDVEQSRIYVNREGILRSIEPPLREEFARFKDSVARKEAQGVMPGVMLINAPTKDREVLALVFDETMTSLDILVTQIRDKFVASDQFGLDTYLSARIRHGTLGGQLRRPLQIEHLITEMDPAGYYKRNEYWEKILTARLGTVPENVLKALLDFTVHVDKLIAKIKDEWLQIRTEKIPGPGLFDLSLSRVVIFQWMVQFAACRTFEEFYDKVIEFLWELTDLALKNIRAKIEKEALAEFLDAISALGQAISNEVGTSGGEINDSIARARTELQNEIERVSGWFRRPVVSEHSDYSLDLPFEVAEAIVRNLHPHVKLQTERNIDTSIRLIGHTRQSLIDMILILLDNVVAHSELNTPKVMLEATVENGRLTIQCTSEVAEIHEGVHWNANRYNQILEGVRAQLRDASAVRLASREGKSGFQKIRRIAAMDLGVEHAIGFEALEERAFRVQIQFDVGTFIR